jgi:hypothetical protein
LRRPFTDSPNAAQSRDGLFDRPKRAEQARVSSHGFRQSLERGSTRARHPEFAQVRPSKTLSRGKDMRKLEATVVLFPYRLAMERNELPSEAASSSDADLLAEDGPNGQFKTVPSARRPQPGTLRDQGRKQRISREMSANRFDVRTKIEHSAHAADDGGQETDLRKSDPHAEAMALRQMRNLDGSHKVANLNRSQVAAVPDNFNAGDRTRSQVGEHGIPIIGWTIPEQERDSPAQARTACGVFSPQTTRRTMKEIPKRLIEPPHAAESRCERDFNHGHPSFMNELLREKDAAGLCHCNGRRPQMLYEQSPELASAYAKTRGQGFNPVTIAVKRAIGN